MSNRSLQRTVCCWLAAAALIPAPAAAQPAGRPIKLIVPTSPGSSADIQARTVGETLQKLLGRPVLAENRVGAGGSIAATAVAAAEPNGETIGVLGNSYLLFPVEFPQQKFDPMQDVAPVAMISRGASVLVVAGTSSYASLSDLVQRARGEPARVSYASAGLGSSTYHSAERVRSAAGLDLIHVPFKGAPEALQEVLAGRVDFAFVPLAVATPTLQSGRARALAVSSSTRSALLPQTPTTVEAGVPGSSYDAWAVALVPARTPAAVQAQLNQAFNAALETPEVLKRFAALGLEPASMPIEDVRAFVRQEYARAMAHAKDTKAR